MARTPVAVRLGLWRLTRHPIVRRLYRSLKARGLFLAQLDRFERETDGAETAVVPEGVSLSMATAAEGVPERLAGDPLAPSDRLVRARRGEATVGSCVISDRTVYVPELRRRLSFDGAYLWRLHVTPEERGRGIGTAIVARAVAAAAADADRIVALVAPDNLPSRRAFCSLGFRPTERFTSVVCGGYRRHRRRPLDGLSPD